MLSIIYCFVVISLSLSFLAQDWESFGFVGSWSSNSSAAGVHQKESTGKDRSPTSSSLQQDHGPVVKEAVRKWAELQAGQRILVTTPSVVVGYRCQVYRSEGATQWYTAVIVGHDEDCGVRIRRQITLCHQFVLILSLSLSPPL